MYIDMLRSQIAALTETRDAALARLDEIASAIEADESRSVATDDEATEVASVESDLRSAQAAIDEAQPRLDELEAIERSRTPNADAPQPPAASRRTREARADDPYDVELSTMARTAANVQDVNERALRAVGAERSLTDEHRGNVERLLADRSINRNGALGRHIIATGRPEYFSAFAKVTRGDNYLTEAEHNAIEEVRAIEAGTDANGGYLMPFTLDPSIILTDGGSTNPVRELASVSTIATDNWNGVTSAGVTASWDGEVEETSDDSPTFDQPAIAVKAMRAFVPFTAWAEDDFANLSADVAMLIGEAFENLEASGFMTGTGVKDPQGLVTGLAAGQTVTSGVGVYALADLDALLDAVPDRWDANTAVLMHRAIITATRGLVTDYDPVGHLETGGYEVRSNPLYKASALDSSVATGNTIVVAGDIRSAYKIVDRIGTVVERVPHLFDTNGRPNGKRGFWARKRVGAGVVNAEAARKLVVG